MDDFTIAFSVGQTPAEVFEAITDVRGWWSGQIGGNTGQPGDEFTYRYENLHRCRIRVTQADPGQKVTWLVLEGGPAFTQNKQEWQGTTINFEISRAGGQTEIRFTHRGLIPQLECFGACSSAWGSYISGSLRSLITTGTGYPSPGSSDPSPTGRHDPGGITKDRAKPLREAAVARDQHLAGRRSTHRSDPHRGLPNQ